MCELFVDVANCSKIVKISNCLKKYLFSHTVSVDQEFRNSLDRQLWLLGYS